MSPAPTYGEPRHSPKPQPIGNFTVLFLLTTCTICGLFLLWRKASAVRTIVAHRLQEWAGDEGAIRLSSDDGPSAREFLEDEVLSDEDVDDLSDEPLSHGQTSRTMKDALLVDHTESPRSSTGERPQAHQDSA